MGTSGERKGKAKLKHLGVEKQPDKRARGCYLGRVTAAFKL